MIVKNISNKLDGQFKPLFGTVITAKDIHDGINANSVTVQQEVLNGVSSINDATVTQTQFDSYDQFVVLRTNGLDTTKTARFQFIATANGSLPIISYYMDVTK